MKNYVAVKKKNVVNGNVNLRLQFKKDGERYYRALDVTGREEDWDSKSGFFIPQSPNSAEKNAFLTNELLRYGKVADNWNLEGKSWSAIDLSGAFDTKVTVVKFNLISFLEDRIVIEKRKDGKNYVHYQNLLNALNKYGPEKDLKLRQVRFSDIDSKFISDFLQYLKDNKRGSIRNIYNCLRSLCQMAINEGEDMTIARFKSVNWRDYVTKKVEDEDDDEDEDSNIIAMDENQMKQFNDFEIEKILTGVVSYDKRDRFLYDLAKFTLYTLMSPCDIAYLKRSNIKEVRGKGLCIVYKRKKTKHKTDKKTYVRITPDIQSLMHRYIDQSVDGYVFPIIDHKKYTTAARVLRRIGTINEQVNVLLKKIGYELELPFPLQWYCMRRTGISYLVNNGIPVTLVAEIAGNTPQIIYKHYLRVGNEGMESQLKGLYADGLLKLKK